MTEEFLLRPAQTEDIPTLANHRRWMMEDLRRNEGKSLDLAMTAALAEKHIAYATPRLGKTLFAWIIEYQGAPIASASLSLLEGNPPHPNNLEGIHPLLHGVYTLPEFRRRGLARRLVETVIEFVRQRGLLFIKLNASKDGRTVYEQLGFIDSNEMRLRL